MAGSHHVPASVNRVTAIEALLFALPFTSQRFVNGLRCYAREHGQALAAPLPLAGDDLSRRLAEVPSFAEWLASAHPPLAWLRRTHPFILDHDLCAFALAVVPWVMAGARGRPPRTRMAWAREHALVDLPYRDRLSGLNGLPNEHALAPVALEVGESERAFLERARAHAQARHADLEEYLREIGRADTLTPALREPDRHAAWWVSRHVDGHDFQDIALAQRPAIDESAVRKAVTRIGQFFR